VLDSTERHISVTIHISLFLAVFVAMLKSVGLGLIVTGVILLVASFIPVPHTYTRPEVERYTLPTTTPVRGVLIDETRVVSAGEYTSNCYIFHRDTTLYISVSVLQGGNRDINFWVMDRENLDSFTSGRAFYYYTAPSRKQISEAYITWKPPTEKEICFVLDNTFSLLSSKTVKISITYEYEVEAQTTITATRTVTETEFLHPFTFFIAPAIAIIAVGAGLVVAGKHQTQPQKASGQAQTH